jgi:hypothetical protein
MKPPANPAALLQQSQQQTNVNRYLHLKQQQYAKVLKQATNK